MPVRDLCDHLHPIATADGLLCAKIDFDFTAFESETETLIPISRVASALSVILHWLSQSKDFRFSGAKVAALAALLDPVNSDYRNLSQVARAAGISRATLSKAILNLRDSNGIRFRMGKSETARYSYRQTQLGLVAAGRHASQRLKKPNSPSFVPRRGSVSACVPQALHAEPSLWSIAARGSTSALRSVPA